MSVDRVVIADIVRARGIRGEVVAKSQTDVPGRLQNLQKAHVLTKDGKSFVVDMQAAWEHKGDWVLKFRGIDSVEAAEQLRGAELWVPLEERGCLADGEYFQSDLVGCQVIDNKTGNAVGIVAGWRHYGGPPLLEIKRETGELLIPFVNEICCHIDLTVRLVQVELPEGLLDL